MAVYFLIMGILLISSCALTGMAAYRVSENGYVAALYGVLAALAAAVLIWWGIAKAPAETPAHACETTQQNGSDQACHTDQSGSEK